MRLLLTRLGASGLKRHNLITLIDTETKEIPFLDIVQDLGDNLYFGSGLTYSGNWLCIGVNSFVGHMGYLLLFNFLNGDTVFIDLPLSNTVKDIVSVFPGQLYLCSEGTHSLNNVSFSPDTGEFKTESIHYKLPQYQSEFSSLCSHQMRWYGTVSGAVIELSNNRVIYSGLTKPHSLFFNSHERICFLDFNKFYCGDDVFYFKHNIMAVYEDKLTAGYWFYTDDGYLQFMDYRGNKGGFVNIGENLVFKMIDVRGCLNEAF